MEPVTLEHFALEILYGVKRIEIPPRRSPFPASPQFTCGVQLRWRGENCGSEYRFWLADIFNSKTFRESFVENMEYEGYEVIWTDTRKHITFVCPDGRRCRDSSLHDETFLKENLETLFAYRQAVGFRPNTPEPEEGWMGELASELVRLGRSIEEADDLPPLPAPPAWTESKQRHREALKKLALGQKLSRGQSWQQTMW